MYDEREFFSINSAVFHSFLRVGESEHVNIISINEKRKENCTLFDILDE